MGREMPGDREPLAPAPAGPLRPADSGPLVRSAGEAAGPGLEPLGVTVDSSLLGPPPPAHAKAAELGSGTPDAARGT